MFCCPGFQHRIENIGQRGIAALVRKSDGEIRFMLQSRGINFDDLENIKATPEIDVYINISCSTGMRYCPFCGYRLSKLVKANPDFFNNLASAHEKFNDFQEL